MKVGRLKVVSVVFLAAALTLANSAQAAAGGAGGRGGYTDENGVYHPPTAGQPGQSDDGAADNDAGSRGTVPAPPSRYDLSGWGRGLPGAPGGAPGRPGRSAPMPAPEIVDPVVEQFENDKRDANQYILSCISQGYTTDSCVRNGLTKLRAPYGCAQPAVRPIPPANRGSNQLE